MINKPMLYFGLLLSPIALHAAEEKMRATSSNCRDPRYVLEANRIIRTAQSKPARDEVLFVPVSPKLKLADLVGQSPSEIVDIIDEIKAIEESQCTPKAYKIILYGPPGSGKTALAEAIAGELGWDFYNILAGDLLTKYQGSGNHNITQLLDTIVKSQKKAVLFIDEIDGLANEEHSDKSSELKRAVHALHKMDAIKENFICILATNNRDKLPATLLSRFREEQICIQLPDRDKRMLLLQSYLTDYAFDAKVLRDIAKLAQNLDCREIQALARKTIRISRFLTRNTTSTSNMASLSHENPKVFLANEAFYIAFYMINKSIAPAGNRIKYVLSYWLKKLCPEITERTLNDLLASQDLIKEMRDLSGEEIKQAIVAGLSLSTEKLLSTEDLIIGIYHGNPSRLPNIQQRMRILNYFMASVNMQISQDMLRFLAEDADDEFTAVELEELVDIAKSLSEASTIPNDFIQHHFIALFKLLERKAKPYMVIESVKTTITRTPDKQPIFNTLELKEFPFTTFTLEKRLLKNKSDYLPIVNFGAEIDQVSRFELGNTKMPSIHLVRAIVKDCLIQENMNLSSSSIINDCEAFSKILLTAQLSCITIKMILLEACFNAAKKSPKTLSQEDLLQALISVGLHPSRYSQIDKFPINTCKSYKRSTQSSYCTIS